MWMGIVEYRVGFCVNWVVFDFLFGFLWFVDLIIDVVWGGEEWGKASIRLLFTNQCVVMSNNMGWFVNSGKGGKCVCVCVKVGIRVCGMGWIVSVWWWNKW